ncbi:MAG: DNA-binding protein WhiA [Synergistales bacterium]|nr:DNA-binding protein WhiA [Synergistales bacterium]
MERLVDTLWEEWLSGPTPGGSACVNEEIRGILWGFAAPRMEEETFLLSGGRLRIFRRLRKLWPNSQFAGQYELGSLLVIPQKRRGKVGLRVPGELFSQLRAPPQRSASGSWAWIRGVWGTTGAFYIPKSGYYLLFRVEKQKNEEQILARVLQRLGVTVGFRRRGTVTEYLLRNKKTIVMFLESMHLPYTAQALQEKGRMRALRDHANKQVNCDAANIRKSLETAYRQIALINALEERVGLGELAPKLRELVELRRQYPSISLKELGQQLSQPVSKSTVEYRWNKIRQYAELMLGDTFEDPAPEAGAEGAPKTNQYRKE